MKLQNKQLIFISVSICISIIVLSCIGFFSFKYIYNINDNNTSIPSLLSEEVFNNKTKYINLIKEIQQLNIELQNNHSKKDIIYLKITKRYNDLNITANMIIAHMKLNPSENNFHINIPPLEFILNNSFDDIITYSFN